MVSFDSVTARYRTALVYKCSRRGRARGSNKNHQNHPVPVSRKRIRSFISTTLRTACEQPAIVVQHPHTSWFPWPRKKPIKLSNIPQKEERGRRKLYFLSTPIHRRQIDKKNKPDRIPLIPLINSSQLITVINSGICVVITIFATMSLSSIQPDYDGKFKSFL